MPKGCFDFAAHRECKYCTWQCRVQIDGRPEQEQEAEASKLYHEHLALHAVTSQKSS